MEEIYHCGEFGERLEDIEAREAAEDRAARGVDLCRKCGREARTLNWAKPPEWVTVACVPCSGEGKQVRREIYSDADRARTAQRAAEWATARDAEWLDVCRKFPGLCNPKGRAAFDAATQERTGNDGTG